MDDMMLIVDDVEMNREILKLIFDKQYEILEAESGEEALEILEGCQGSIDIVLLDLIMPGVDGFEVLKRRQKMEFFKKIPVVVITSSGDLQDQIKAFKLGANEYINKPFVPEIVASRVNNVVASYRRMLSIELEAQKMKTKSELDEMTGLYNKVTTEYAMNSIFEISKNRLEAMMIIDIDNFKSVNDTAGHQVGDHVIKIIANLISSLFRKSDIVGRVGGDEFCVMMVDVPNMDIVYSKVNEIVQIMRYKPNLTIPEYVTLSIGLATNDRKSTTYSEMFKKADEALYEAKQNGKAQYREYGVVPKEVNMDERCVAILLSHSRNICSVIHALVPADVRVEEVLKPSELDFLIPELKEKAQIMFVDVSDGVEEEEALWTQIKSLDWMDMGNVLAICEEGNVEQYMYALQSGVADMITAPIDHEAFKRRMLRQLTKLGMYEEKE